MSHSVWVFVLSDFEQKDSGISIEGIGSHPVIVWQSMTVHENMF